MSTAKDKFVETAHVTGRRTLHYANVDKLLADAEYLQSAGYERLGNWSLGQIAKHLATGMDIALDGSPIKAPIVLRFVARRFFKERALRQMQPGFKLPTKFAKRFVPTETDDAVGVELLRTAVRRWKTEPQRHAQPFFGPLTDDEWNRLVLRHGELHMSFLMPKQALA